MAGAHDRVVERAMLGHQRDSMFDIIFDRLATLERAAPELALAVAPAAEREHDRERDFAFTEIISNVLAELGCLAAIVQHIVDELEGDAEIHAERAARRLLGF